MLFKKSDAFGEGRFRFRRTRAAYKSVWFWWTSLGFLMLVTAVFAVVQLIPQDPERTGPAKAVAAVRSAATAVPAPSPAAGKEPEVSFTGCKAQKAPPLDPEFSAPAPVQSEWAAVGTMKAPRSDTGGPQVGSVCFTRTPEGALYSAANYVAEFLTLDPSGREALMSQRYYNPGGPQVQAQDMPTLINNPAASNVPDAAREFAGYRWETWTSDLAIVSIAFRWLSGQMTGAVYLATYTLTWSDNDWKLLSPGRDGVPVAYVTGENAAQAQYTPWGP